MSLKHLLLAVSLGTPGAFAEQNMLEMDLEQLLQVSITGATLREESIKTVPSAATVFTREQIESLGLDYLHELLSLVPGLQINRGADSPINYSYSIRGRRQGGRAHEVLLLVDGRELSDPRSGGADSALYLFPLANIERVEVIRGPASAIYGSGAFTGVINVISRKNVNRVRITAGELQRRSADINLTHSADEWRTDLYAHIAEDAGQSYRVNTPDVAGTVATSDPRQETVLDWSLAYRQTQVRAFVSRLEAEDFYSVERVNNDINYYLQESQHFRIEQEFTPSEAWKTDVSLNYQRAEQFLHGEVRPSGAMAAISSPASTAPMLAKAHLGGEAYRVIISNDVTVNNDLSVQFGGEWAHERETDAKTRTTYDLEQLVHQDLPVRHYGNFNRRFAIGREESRDLGGLYVQALYNLSDSTRLVGGLRHDHYESVTGYTSPRLAVIHQLTGHQTLKLLYGEAFRAPSFAETGILNNPVLVGNAGLDNEAVKTLEFMWMGTWNTLSTGVSVYRNRFINPIGGGWINNVRTYVNNENEDNYGAGLRIDWQPTPQWMLRAQYTSLRDLPDAYFREADESTALIANYQRGNWNWNLSAINNMERDYLLTTTQRATLESYWVANTQLRYQLSRSSSLALSAKNMFDKTFATPPQGAGIIGGVPNRGREASIGWQWEW